jgi:hypothetical protein
MRLGSHLGVFTLACFMALFSAEAGLAQPCTIKFDDITCPGTECAATFMGGTGCQSASAPLCYTSESMAYRVDANNPLTITLSTGIVEIDVFFAHRAGSTGTMTFFDAVVGGNPVGTPINTADCGAPPKPDNVNQVFSTAIRRIQVDVTGGGDVWIDDLTLTPGGTPVNPLTWGLLKDLYR